MPRATNRPSSCPPHTAPPLISRIERAFIVLSCASICALAVPAAALAQNAIVTENQLTGNPPSEWQVSGAGDPSIQGFATDISVNRGETVHFKVKTDAASFHFDIYRVGYYQGNGARFIATVSGTPATQPDPIVDTALGLVDCGNWTESGSWDVPADAVSGVYLARVIRDDNQAASHIVFIVRDDASTSSLLFQTSDATWQAYNTYGGYSLYGGSTAYPGGHAVKVSYNRPFSTRDSPTEDFFFNAEYPMVRFLEANGYDVSYSTDVDSDRHGNLIAQHGTFLSVGHDEYWSAAQRANVAAARDAGKSLAFFSGNEIYWKVRYEPSTDGANTPYRTLVCYKEGTLGELACGSKCDPEANVWTGLWRDGCAPAYSVPDACAPENALSGNISWHGTSGALEVPGTFAPLRLWRNTSVASLGPEGSLTLPDGTLGYEWDFEQFGASYPASRIALSSTTSDGLTHHLSLYRAGSSLVFGAGTVQWSWGLDDQHDRGSNPPSPVMQQATVNLLAEMGAQAATIQGGLIPAIASGDVTPPSVSITSPADGASLPSGAGTTLYGTASDAGGTVARVQVSLDGGVTWANANGTTNWSYPWTPGAPGAVQLRVRAADDWSNLDPIGAVANVTVTPATSFTFPASIWPPTTVPANVDPGDGTSGELGVKFRTDLNGYIQGIRFYKSPANGGTHIADLWTGAGQPLGSATFSGESADGWQQVAFNPPVAVSAGVTYVASVFMPQGHYSFNGGFFTSSGVDAPPLHALQEGVDGSNGVYLYTPTHAFPTQSFNSANYWVDVVFDTAGTPDVTPPTVLSTSPGPGASGVAVGSSITALFSESLDPASVSSATFELRDPSNALVPASVTYDAPSHGVILHPNVPLAYSAVYTAALHGGATEPRIRDIAGNALAADHVWSFTTSAPPPPPPDEGPGGPILVVGTTSNPFSRYYAEILRAEGFNEFNVTDITLVTPEVLTHYDVVILGEMSVAAGQVTMFSDWVNAGGLLITMRPDPQFAGVLGLTPAGGTLSDRYLKANAAQPISAGITPETIQFHGVADRYTLNGATALATLYSDAGTATTEPAVTLRDVGPGGGCIAAFTYDLARSVVYTRQGNPAWAGQERDGTPPIRSDDLFFGNAAADPQPDWVDLSKVAIPQADEQQRLLANLIVLDNLHRKPLPRFWYLPKGKKAAIIMTGDNHGDAGMQPRFDIYRNESAANCSVDDWECVRATGYLYVGSTFTPAQAQFYNDLGFEVALHVNTGCNDWIPSSLEAFFASQLGQFTATYPNILPPTTNRTHCIAWSDWSTQPETELAHGIRLDTNYYYWPPAWVQDRPGLFTGSGFPMRFARTDGSMIDCYQAATQMTDESGQSYPMTSDSLLARALDPRGYYGAFCANMHFDTADHPGSNAIVASAQASGIPVVSAKQMLEWLDGRNGSSFANLTWDGSHLGFGIAVGAGGRNLRGMLPSHDGTALLVSLTLDGGPLSFTLETIKGVEYAFFPASPGNYVATYETDTTPPVISARALAPGPNGTSATVTWDTDEPADSRVDYASSGPLQSATDAALVTHHSVPLTGLSPATIYSYRVTSRDASANAATDPPINSPAAQFQTSAAPCAVDRVAADFSAGQLAGTYVSLTDDGEVILAPALGAEFDVMPPTSEWQSFPWQGGGASSLASGSLLVDGARFNSEPEAGYAPERSLEFVATFAAVPFQHVGFGGGGDNEPNAEFDTSPWAIFSTGTSGSSLMARAWNGGPFLDTQLPAVTLGLPHRFRIDWLSARVDFYVDGTLAHSEPVSITGPMRPAASDFAVGGGGVSVDWMRLSPYSANGTFESRVFDAASPATWGAATWSADVPAGTSLSIEARVGDTSTPDESWTPYAPLASSGSSVGLTARYLQYRLNLATGDPTLTPALRDLQVECSLPLAAVQHVALPAVTMARPAMPNPSSGRTTIAYVIGTDAAAQGQTAVSLTVYDMSGRAVRSLVRGPQSAGNYRAVWDATDDQGRGVRPGVYYFSLRAGRIRHQGKMVLLH